MNQRLKDLAKRSDFLIATVRAIRAVRGDTRKLYGWLTRMPRISRYLHENEIRKLQIGTSDSVKAGWLNTDLIPERREVIYLDATATFPFSDNTFDYICSEHMIEHIGYEAGFFMLGECFRVLKPGGTIRISTPDLKVYTNLHSTRKTAAQQFYVDWMIQRFMPHVEDCKEVFLINNAFRAWGHQFLYDRDTLSLALTKVGFENITFWHPGDSDDEHLRNVESHGSVMGCEEINQFEAFAVEARSPRFQGN